MERKYSVPSNPESRAFSGTASEDLHAWSIYRQNLNSDFTDSALGSTDKSPLPYGNFQLRDTTVQSILSHPRYGPKSTLGSNMYTYLKFGLPRVFPPNQNGSNHSGTPQNFHRSTSGRPKGRDAKSGGRGLRDGSSGYDSSDNETHNVNQYNKNHRKYRSDPDFRMQNIIYQQQQQQALGAPTSAPLAALQQGGLRSGKWSRNKSISEANLLNGDYSPSKLTLRDTRRNSVADFAYHQHVESGMRPLSKAESHLSLATAAVQHRSMVPGEYMGHNEDIRPPHMYPHLQVHGLSVLPKSKSGMRGRPHFLINNVSFEARGGEVLAIMATSEAEGTVILDVLAGRKNHTVGDILLNGQIVRRSILRDSVSYVQNDTNLAEDMTIVQTLNFYYDLKRPTSKLEHLKIDTIDRINVLIEDLGLEQVRNTKVSSLTLSEKQRLNVACHLLLDTDVVLLDQPTKGMDIFDTFFLVEYLRQWANGGSGHALGRVVILTLHPPTYEIFTMLSRILLISAGRTMFSGRRRDMLPYFTLVDYPCPAYKNPSDYYLDLVTLDDLSAEAMLESSQRIEQLAELFRQKQQPMSDPGPPAALPMTINRTSAISKGFTLLMKSLIYTQPNTFINWLGAVVLAGSLSVIMGAVFWDVPNTDPQLNLNDRLGYHYATMSFMYLPIMFRLVVSEERKNRRVIKRDIGDELYGRFTYILAKCIANLLPSLFIWLVFLVPAYSMSGLHFQSTSNYHGFYIYLGLMLMYFCCIQIFITFLAYVIPWDALSTILSVLFLGSCSFISGYLLHYKHLPYHFHWLQYVNPEAWLLPKLLLREYSPEAIASSSATTLCRNKQVQHQDIIVQLPCPPPNGTQVLSYYGYLDTQHIFNVYDNHITALLIFYCVCFVLVCFGYIFIRKRHKTYAARQ